MFRYLYDCTELLAWNYAWILLSKINEEMYNSEWLQIWTIPKVLVNQLIFFLQKVQRLLNSALWSFKVSSWIFQVLRNDRRKQLNKLKTSFLKYLHVQILLLKSISKRKFLLTSFYGHNFYYQSFCYFSRLQNIKYWKLAGPPGVARGL